MVLCRSIVPPGPRELIATLEPFARGTQAASEGRMVRILVVDDDPAVRSVVTDALQQDGYQVDAACNGQQALTSFAKHPPDALVLDLDMPVMDGPTLVRTLRERTKWGGVPLMVVSAESGLDQTGPRLGASACLSKPFDVGELLHNVEQMAPRA